MFPGQWLLNFGRHLMGSGVQCQPIGEQLPSGPREAEQGESPCLAPTGAMLLVEQVQPHLPLGDHGLVPVWEFHESPF